MKKLHCTVIVREVKLIRHTSRYVFQSTHRICILGNPCEPLITANFGYDEKL